MDKSNSIIPHRQSELLPKVTNSLEITNKILAKSEQKLIPYRMKDKWGFCTSDKKIMIDCIYERVKRFSEGFSAVKLNNKWGFINVYGETVIPFAYDEAVSFSNNTSFVLFHGNLYKIDKDDKLQLVKLEPGWKWSFGDETLEDCIFKDKEGRAGCAATFRIVGTTCFSLETFFVDGYNLFNERKAVEGMIAFMEDEKFGFKSLNGTTTIPAIYDDGYDFKDGFAFVKFNGEWGYINMVGFQYWED